VPPDRARSNYWADELGVSPLIAQLLISRGIHHLDAARAFFSSSLDSLHNPSLLTDMDTAVAEIATAVRNTKRVRVYGDYDVDGITGTVVLLTVLRRAGAMVDYYIPDRLVEGYGVNQDALLQATSEGIDLLITVDCGISALEEIEQAREVGLRVIVTDHHEAPEVLPPAVAVVNPKRRDAAYPFRNLAGVGVAFKLAQAISERMGLPDCDDLLDIVALGTIADVVPLTGENRVLVTKGLERLAVTSRPGLKALAKIARMGRSGDISVGQVAFGMAPRINACGRMGHADAAVELLLTESESRGKELAHLLDAENEARRTIENQVFEEAVQYLEGNHLLDDLVLVAVGQGWHPGVIGIVASRLVETYYRPVVVIAIEDDGGKGSARSITGFSILDALAACKGQLSGFGGHSAAAGLTVEVGRVPGFREAINDYAASVLEPRDLVEEIVLDAVIDLRELSLELVDELKALEPHGFGNASPQFCATPVEIVKARAVGNDGAHLQVVCRQGDVAVKGISFGNGHLASELDEGQKVSIAFTPIRNTWQGQESVELSIKGFDTSEGQSLTALNLPASLLQRQALEAAKGIETIPSWQGRSTAESKESRWRLPGDTPGFAQVTDGRDLLEGLSLSEGNHLLWVVHGGTANHLAWQLLRRYPDLGRATIVWHQGLVASDGDEVANWLGSSADRDGLRILIVDGYSFPEAIVSWIKANPIGHCHALTPGIYPGLFADSLLRSGILEAGKTRLHLGYSSDDIGVTRHLARSMIPGRDELVSLFVVLRGLARGLGSDAPADIGEDGAGLGTRVFPASMKEIGQHCTGYLGRTVGPGLVANGAAVLKELGLLRLPEAWPDAGRPRAAVDTVFQWTYIPPQPDNGGRLELQESETYRFFQLIRAGLEDWLSFAADAPARDIARAFLAENAWEGKVNGL